MPAPFDVPATDRWLPQLPEPARGRLLALGAPRRVEAGRRIVARDQPHTGLYCLLAGTAHVMNPPFAGQDCFLDALAPPAWFGEAGLFDGGPHTHDVCARSACRLLFFPREAVLATAAGEPALWGWLGRLLASRLRLTYFVLDELSPLPADARVARHLLIKAAESPPVDGGAPAVRIHQEDLARGMGLSRSSITPILADWRRRGVVHVRYGAITLLDVEALKATAGYAAWPQYCRELLACVRGPAGRFVQISPNAPAATPYAGSLQKHLPNTKELP